MATKTKKRTIKQTKKVSVSPLGILVTIIGFYVMSMGTWDSFTSLVLSPIILFIAYVIIFPLSIFFRKKSEEKNQDNEIDSGKS